MLIVTTESSVLNVCHTVAQDLKALLCDSLKCTHVDVICSLPLDYHDLFWQFAYKLVICRSTESSEHPSMFEQYKFLFL